MNERLGIGVIGVGRIGRMHADLLSRRVEGAALAAVADAMPATARAVADDLGVPACPIDALLSDPRIGAVAICSPSDTHLDLIVAAAKAGKAIFCEKPISLNLAEVDRSLAAADAAGVALMIGFNRRFDPAHASVAQAVASGEIGDPHLVRISSRDPAPPPLEYAAQSGGIFLDMTIHDFDMARFVSGSDVTEAFALGALRIEPGLAAFGDVDTAAVQLRHENGCLTLIDNSRQAVYGYDQRVEVLGSKGMAASGNPSAHTGVVYTADGTRSSTMPYFFLERYIPSYVHQWQAFVDAVRAGAPPPTTGADGRAPLIIGLAAMRSLREHRPVTTAEIEAAG